MKIAQIVCTFPPYKGGMGNSAFAQAQILSDLGNSVTVFTPLYQKINTIKYSFDVQRLKPFLKYGNAAFLPNIIYKLKNFDIINLHYPFFGTAELIWLYKLLNKNKFKLAIHFHMDTDSLSPFAKIMSLPAELIKNSLFKNADIITCASIDYIKNTGINIIYNKYKNKFVSIPFGVDTHKFSPRNNIVSTSEKKVTDILFVGALDKAHYFKGVNYLLNAVSQLEDKNWQLHIVGKGDLLDEYKLLAKNLNINEQVNFYTNVTNAMLPDMYKKSDIFVLPSINNHEAFGIVLLEAMSSGLPVIASNLPGVREVFTDKEGIYSKPGDVSDLKNKLEYLLKNKTIRIQMGKNARLLAEDKYDWQKIGTKLNQLYKNL